MRCWIAALPDILSNWQDARREHERLLLESGFRPCVEFPKELMFEPAEYSCMVNISERLKTEAEKDR